MISSHFRRSKFLLLYHTNISNRCFFILISLFHRNKHMKQRRRGVPDPQQVKILFALPGVHTFLRMGITDRHPGIFLFPLKFFFPRHCYHLQSFLFSGIYAPATSSGRVVSTLYNRVSFGK